MEILIGLVVVAMIGLIWSVSTSNRFTRLEHLMKESWANVDVALTRRHDLIPNLVATVKAFAAHEEEVLERLVQLRARAAETRSAKDENALSHALSAVVMRSEAYPELRSSQAYLQLMKELINTEDRIAAARRFYNANVRDYNILRESFPASILAGGRTSADLYEIDDVDIRANLSVASLAPEDGPSHEQRTS